MTLATILAFLRSPLGRYAIGAVAVLMLLGAVWMHGRHAGKEAAERRCEKRVEAVQRDLDTARLNAASLSAALDRQNAANQAAADESARKLSAATAALETAQAARKSALARAAKLEAAKLSDGTACERVEEADRLVMEGLR